MAELNYIIIKMIYYYNFIKFRRKVHRFHRREICHNIFFNRQIKRATIELQNICLAKGVGTPKSRGRAAEIFYGRK